MYKSVNQQTLDANSDHDRQLQLATWFLYAM